MGLDQRRMEKLGLKGRHADFLRKMDEQALRLLERLPGADVERTRDSIEITVDDVMENGVVLILTPEALELRLPSMDWVHPHWSVPTSRLWKRVKWERIEDLYDLVAEAREKRRAEFRECKFCHERFPPEGRHGRAVCHVCAEEHLGIVH